MKIFVTGTRGIPDIPGGVEKHCQELFPRIVQNGHEVILATRNSYVTQKMKEWQGVKLINCFAPRTKSLEAVVHTFIAMLKACRHRPDFIHVHAIGPSLLTPLARILGFKVVVTNHGPEYNRQKWGRVAKLVLKLGERIGTIFANEVIAVSSVIKGIIHERYQRRSNVIYNGVSFPTPSIGNNFLKKIDAAPRNYILSVARFVPEKGLHDLIEAFKNIKEDYKLVIAGDADHETDYSKLLHRMASEDDRIILTGYITGEPLNQIYSHALLFVLPSYHEGLPIALLEAMSFSIPVLASDIPANKEVGLESNRYFKCGNILDLKTKIMALTKNGYSENEKKRIYAQISEKYNWDRIAEQTIKVYEQAIN